ncbi:MAG: hypothetical protein K2K81_07325 [Muribaculaceae bacterium]|nr:hypothetical protein [Muribaculaceae bacterium]
MKTTLTIEESAKLIELGVDAKLASSYVGMYRVPTFTLTDILSILPKEIDGYHLSIEASSQGYEVSYMLWDIGDEAYHFMGATERPELIDALNQLAIWCLENNHIKTDKK